MKFFFTTLLLSFFLTGLISAQSGLSTRTAGQSINFASYNKTMDKYVVNDEIDGSRYLNDKFTVGTINPIEGSYPLRYNLIDDVIEAQISKDSIFIVDKKNTNYLIKIGNKIYKSFKHDNNYHYFNIITSNKNVNLLKRITKKFVEEKKAINSYSTGKKAYYSKAKVAYFIYLEKENKVVELPTKNKKLIKLFSDNENEIKNYIKKEKLNLKDFSDSVKVIDYIDTLYQ